MEPDEKSKIANLGAEMDAIHCANGLYWRQGGSQTLAAKGDYQFRQERLEKIRAELAQLHSS